MDACETYAFDIQGYCVVPDVLDADLLRALQAQLDRANDGAPEHTPGTVAISHILSWRGAVLSLIDHPRIRPYLEALLPLAAYTSPELGPGYRLDHTYAVTIKPGATDAGAYYLHGGGTPLDPGQWYQVRQGRMHNGLVVVAFQLSDVGPEDGGFGCIPGSHKANFPLPQVWSDLRQAPHPLARAVPAKAGSAIIFTEALSHGTLPWRGTHARRTLFFKYNAYCTAWSPLYLDEATQDWPELSDAQRTILRAPFARSPGHRRPVLQPA